MLSFKNFTALHKDKHKDGTFSALEMEIAESQKIYANLLGIISDKEKLVPFEEYHCTLTYCRQPCLGLMYENPPLPLTASVEKYQILGEGMLVLVLDAPAISKIHKELCSKYDIKWDYPSYIPHVSIANDWKGDVPKKLPVSDITFTSYVVKPLEKDRIDESLISGA